LTGSARRSRGRPPIPRDRIIEAAVHIVDLHGADALSMRTLAQQLNSGTATLYRHFANRSELIAEVVDHVFGEVDFDADELITAGWQHAGKRAAHAMFDALRRHANVSRLLIEQVPVGPNAMLHRERLIAVLLSSGFPPKLAARSYATLARYVLGFAIQLTGPQTAGQVDPADLSKVFHGANPKVFPATIRVADHLPVPLEDEFEFGLDLIIDGLTQQRHKRPRKA
jgi:AcrR family transcriptional regulator